MLIDRERRQVFGYLSSPNCFLFSDVQGLSVPFASCSLAAVLMLLTVFVCAEFVRVLRLRLPGAVSLTEEDLDLLLAAGA